MLNKRTIKFLIIWFIIFLCVILVTSKAVISLYIMIIMLPFYFKKSQEQMIIAMMYILISTPIIGNTTGIFNIKGFNILDILIILVFILVLIKYVNKYKGIKNNLIFLDKLIILYFILNVFPIIKGFLKYGTDVFEVKFIFIPIILYFIFKLSEIIITLKNICKIIFNSVAIYSILILIIIKVGNIDSLALVDYEGRIAINITVFIFSIVYGVYMLLKYEMSIKSKVTIVIVLIVQLYLYSLNMSRAVLLLLIAGLIGCYIISYLDTEKNKNINIVINILGVIFLGIISIIVYNYMKDIINPIIDRVMDMVNKTGTYSNFSVRTGTADYYIPIITNQPMGAGWGSKMILIHPEGYIIYNNGFMDNFFITLGYKAGWIICAIYIYILILTYYKIIKLIKISEKEMKLFIVQFPLLIIGTNYITAQAYHTMTTTATLWIIIYFTSYANKYISS